MGEGEVGGFEELYVFGRIGGVLGFEGAVGGVSVENLEAEGFVFKEEGTKE